MFSLFQSESKKCKEKQRWEEGAMVSDGNSSSVSSVTQLFLISCIPELASCKLDYIIIINFSLFEQWEELPNSTGIISPRQLPCPKHCPKHHGGDGAQQIEILSSYCLLEQIINNDYSASHTVNRALRMTRWKTGGPKGVPAARGWALYWVFSNRI